MNQQHLELGYSLKWASKVVEDFTRKYVRATYLVGEYYDIDVERVAVWCASNQERWRNYKKIVKLVHRWVLQQERFRPYPEELLNSCILGAYKFLRKSGDLL